EIDLVAHADDDRQLHGRHGARDDLLVERPEVFERAAAAREDQDVALGALVGERERTRDFLGGTRALDGCGVDQYAHGGEAPPQRDQHVADRGARGRRDDADAAWQMRDWDLARGLEQPFGRELALEPLEFAAQYAFAGFL